MTSPPRRRRFAFRFLVYHQADVGDDGCQQKEEEHREDRDNGDHPFLTAKHVIVIVAFEDRSKAPAEINPELLS